jgi:hypothetical protein
VTSRGGTPRAQAAPSKLAKKIPTFFFRTGSGNEPVREWLKDQLTARERKLVGEDIKTAE